MRIPLPDGKRGERRGLSLPEELLLWLELPSERIVSLEAVDPKVPTSLTTALLQAMKKPARGAVQRPARIRVEDGATAAELRRALPDIEITVGPLPELDARVADLVTDLLAHLLADLPANLAAKTGAADDPRSYFEDGRVSGRAVKALFRAAASVYESAPWEVAWDDQVLRLDIPALGVAGACVSILGAAGACYGLLILPSLAAFEALVERAEGLILGEADLGIDVLALNFESVEDLPPRMQREIKQHGWPVAGPLAYPLVEHRAADGGWHPLHERDVQIATACASAVARFVAKHSQALEDDCPEEITESYSESGFTVHLSAPFEPADEYSADDDFDGDDLDGDDLDGDDLGGDDLGGDDLGGDDLGDHPPVSAMPDQRTQPKISRNAPCPCGSGQKYKKCCLGTTNHRPPAPVSDGQHLARGHVIDARLVTQLRRFQQRHFPHAWPLAAQDFDDEEYSLQLFGPWLFYAFLVDGQTLAEHFLEQQGASLSMEEREWLHAQRQAWLSVWEVLAVEPGQRITLQDLLSGEQRTVKDAAGSAVLTKRDTLLARIIDFDGEALLCGCHPNPLSPLHAAEVVRRVRGRLRRKTAVPVERLRDEALGRYLIARWDEVAAARRAHAATPPQLHNTDGDALLLTRDHFTFDPAQRAQIAGQLSTIARAEPADEEGEVFVFLRQGNAMHRDWESTVIGRAVLAEKELTVESNSAKRADKLRLRIEGASQGRLSHRVREHTDPLSQRAPQPTRPAHASPIPTAEAEQILRDYKARHYQRWIDEPLPALGGLTPRQASRQKGWRGQLDALLKDIEHAEHRLPGGPQVDLRGVRAELGLL